MYSILQHKCVVRKGRRLATEFLVRWLGYGPWFDKLMKFKDLDSATDLVNDYEEDLRATEPPLPDPGTDTAPATGSRTSIPSPKPGSKDRSKEASFILLPPPLSGLKMPSRATPTRSFAEAAGFPGGGAEAGVQGRPQLLMLLRGCHGASSGSHCQAVYTEVVKKQIWKVTQTFLAVDQFRGFCFRFG